jgi:Fe-S oxidoreductase
MRTRLFVSCYVDTLYLETGMAMVRLLERLRPEVDCTEAQTCCGQMPFNTGYQQEALPLLRHFLDTFLYSEMIVGPSAGRVRMTREFYPCLVEQQKDDALLRDVQALTDYHLCIAKDEQVVGLVPEAIGQLRAAVQNGHSLTFTSGPSAPVTLHSSVWRACMAPEPWRFYWSWKEYFDD